MLSRKILTRVLIYCIFITTASAMAQNRTVTGTTTSEDGAPLLGVNIIQKGTSNGVVSDFDGNYQIQLVPGNETLVFSFVGFIPVQQKVSARSVVDVVMQTDSESLDEVVVVGYGSTRKSDITGAVSSVSSQDLEKAVYNNVDELLQGRSAGVQVTSSSGAPDAGASIIIRGNNSISGSNAPLYVVDGIPISGNPNFNPQEIQSIEILKDASATSIYGSRGANGVILISTKRGEIGKTSINVTSRSSISDVIQTYDMLNGQQYAEYRNEANLDLEREIPFPNPEQYAGEGFNWVDEILRKGIRNEYGVNFSGGSENMKFFVSGNLLDDKGIVEGSEYTRGSLRANVDASAFDDFLNIKFSMNGTHSKNNRAITGTRAFPASGGPIFNALTAEPIVPSRDYSGFTGEGEQFYNPYLEVTAKDDRQFITDILASTEATFNFSEHFSYTFNGGINFTTNKRDIFTPSNVGSGINTNGNASTSTNQGYDYIVSNYLTYNNVFNEVHDLTVLAGVEYSEFNNYVTNANVQDFGIEILGSDNLGIGTGDDDIGSGRNLSVLQSGFLRLNYGFDDRYLVTATIRADGSSRFAENEKWGYFPSAAFVWRASQEDFLKDNKTISDLKFRATYGAVGSQAIAPYQSLARYGTVVYGVGNTPTLSYVPQSVANPDLKWETTKQLDLGFELGLLNNRIDITFDYFKKTTEDLLQNIQIPQQSGFGGALVNFGSIENEGIEFAINAYVVQNDNFTWNSDFNFTTYKTTVIELGGDEEIFGPGLGANVFGRGHIYRPGEEFGRFYGLKAIGLIQPEDFDSEGIIDVPTRNGVTDLGSWKFEDVDGNGIINNEDRTIIGNPNPDFIFGWNNDFYYKNFSLNVFVQGSIGNDIYNTIGTAISSGFDNNESYKNQTVDWFENRWTPNNQTNDIHYPAINSVSPPTSNFMVEDGSYVRLKNVRLSYEIPFRDMALTSLQISLIGTNLITITDYTGFDPEVSSLGANSLAPGVDLGTYPRQQGYTLGLNLKF